MIKKKIQKLWLGVFHSKIYSELKFYIPPTLSAAPTLSASHMFPFSSSSARFFCQACCRSRMFKTEFNNLLSLLLLYINTSH